tara:strand:+ start:71 stop:553 length:483 start_codon:yes stop_codon:yes gene_type:complete
MNTKIINGQTYYESEDVEAEFILLQEKKENIYSDIIADFIMITVGKINNMTKKDIIWKYYGEEANDSRKVEIIKADYFAKLLCEKYDLNINTFESIINNYLSIYKQLWAKNPFTKRKTKKIEYETNDLNFTEYLIETHWDAFKSKKYNFIQNHDLYYDNN